MTGVQTCALPICLVVVEAIDGLPAPGSTIMVGDREIGTLGTVVGHRALAIIRLDKAAAAEVPITAAGVELKVSLPKGATFSLIPDATTHD